MLQRYKGSKSPARKTKNKRHRQDLNLRGRSPVDFESTSLTTRTRCRDILWHFKLIKTIVLAAFAWIMVFQVFLCVFIPRQNKQTKIHRNNAWPFSQQLAGKKKSKSRQKTYSHLIDWLLTLSICCIYWYLLLNELPARTKKENDASNHPKSFIQQPKGKRRQMNNTNTFINQSSNTRIKTVYRNHTSNASSYLFIWHDFLSEATETTNNRILSYLFSMSGQLVAPWRQSIVTQLNIRQGDPNRNFNLLRYIRSKLHIHRSKWT